MDLAASPGSWLDTQTDLSPFRSSRVNKKSSEACGTSMGSQGGNNYHLFRKYWQPLPRSLHSFISFTVHRYRVFPLRRTRAAHPTMPPLHPCLTELLLAPIAPLGTVSSSQPSARPPAASIPSAPTVERSPFMVNAGGQQRSRQPGNAEGSRYQHGGGDAAFLPGCAVDVKFCSPRSATEPDAAILLQ